MKKLRDLTVRPDQNGALDTLQLLDILNLAHFKVYVVDVATHEIIYANHLPAFQGESDRLKCYQLIYQQEQTCLSCKMSELLAAPGESDGSIVTYERFNEADDCWYQLQEGVFSLPDGRRAMFSIVNDISAIKAMQNDLSEAHAELAFKNQQLENLSITDRLTGLFNRRKFDELFVRECERAQRTGLPLSVLMVDIDHFKSVNDSYGHQVGDQVLVAVASLLAQGVRKLDTVARWGGEEFMILCPATQLAGACALAENIRATIQSFDFPTVGKKTCCFGVAQYRSGEAGDALIERADAALYRAKHDGRNLVRGSSE